MNVLPSILLSLSLCLSSVLPAQLQPQSPPPDSVTVLVYMIASDLEGDSGQATEDLNEMLNATLGEHLNVVVQSGGTEEWHNDWMENGATQRFLITEDEVQLLETLDHAPMTAPDTLTEFLVWGTESYPAERNLLIFWDHGGGTYQGFGLDETAKNDSLMLDELAEGLRGAGRHFDLIGFDACLMATMSNAYMLRDYADYLLASEELEPLRGWEYCTWLTELGRNPTMEIDALAETIATSYLEDAVEQNWSEATLSLIDLSAMSDVVTAWRELTGSLYDELEAGGFQRVDTALTGAKHYGMGSHYDQIDLMDWLEELDEQELAKTDALRNSVEQAVVQVWNTPELEDTHGLALYVPYHRWKKYSSEVEPALLGIGFSEQDLRFYRALVPLLEEYGAGKVHW